MKLLPLLVVLCGGTMLAAHGQAAYKPASAFDWKIAQRLDSGRVLYHYYEGISIEVSKYPPAGPGSPQVIAKFGAGC